MKCVRCGSELEQDAAFCDKCGFPTETKELQETVSEPEEQITGTKSEETEPGPNKKFMRILAVAVVILAVVSVGALAFVKWSVKDPKEVVIQAFENIWPKDQVLPSEEMFGFKEFSESALTADSDGGFTLKLDSCSEPSINQFAGSGLRFQAKSDKKNRKSSLNVGVIYNGMDLVNLNGYYGDETSMVSIPELSGRVFTLDVSDGLGERIANAPYLGKLLEEQGVDISILSSYFSEIVAQADRIEKEGKAPFDFEALMKRYKEGCKAQENFKAALTVEKASKGTYTMNGKEVSCQGYEVLISKDSMIEFLRTSSDFFLQDETLRQDFLNQMESTVRMTELMGGGFSGMAMPSAKELQEQSYDEAKKGVEEMIRYLDGSLSDVRMTVYVDRKGNLAAVEGSTQMNLEERADISFHWELQGGSYLTQNFKGNVIVQKGEEALNVDVIRESSYNKKQLVDDISVNIHFPDDVYKVAYNSSYDSESGDFQTSVGLENQGIQVVEASMSGVIDQLEKGKLIHMDIDSLEFGAMDHYVNMALSGEYYYKPLEGEITPLEGETMDVLAATESDWKDVGTEIMLNAFSVFSQVGVR